MLFCSRELIGRKSRRRMLHFSVAIGALLCTRPSTSFSPSLSARGSRLHEQSNQDEAPILPKHVAFICDGNSRWASARNLPTAAGHAAGAERLVEVLESLRKRSGVSHCTMYAFSTENWKRPQCEIDEILGIMEATARRFHRSILRDRVKVHIIGDLTDRRLPASLISVLETLRDESFQASRHEVEPLILSIAVNYGGRQDILDASKKVAALIVEGAIDPASVTEDTFSHFLSTSPIPDPDLIIRTSGECRLSNFLLWNAAYSELYFTQSFWPDFDAKELDKALTWFAKRKRTFGARKTQPTPTSG